VVLCERGGLVYRGREEAVLIRERRGEVVLRGREEELRGKESVRLYWKKDLVLREMECLVCHLA
jgi:hypothetical protein